ncbi:formin-E-like [Hibiscus syriacus]|uniref:Formin-E-like n=1 Tax=Hibiscus syriacus TaxID=106335 RepID=A0A6A3CNU9_HIBSY|nr:formin-E-like [Hibiscus syriacus]
MGQQEETYMNSWPPVGAPLTIQRQDQWRQFDNSVNAVSFGFVATAILISMFIVMAIFERFLRPNSPPPHGPGHGGDLESQLGFNGKLRNSSPQFKLAVDLHHEKHIVYATAFHDADVRPTGLLFRTPFFNFKIRFCGIGSYRGSSDVADYGMLECPWNPVGVGSNSIHTICLIFCVRTLESSDMMSRVVFLSGNFWGTLKFHG